MAVALILSTAFVATKPEGPNRNVRINQYLNGLGEVAELTQTYPVYDVFSVDNTVEAEAQVDSRVLAAVNRIPGLKSTCYFLDNRLGQINKGSGLIVQWNRILPALLGKYEYTVHYEPRLRLVNTSFFERMEKMPAAYLGLEQGRVSRFRLLRRLEALPWASGLLTVAPFFTGLFSMRTSDLAAYCKAADPAALVCWPGCVEADLFGWVRRAKIPHTQLPALGVRWHDEAEGTWLDY